MHIVLRNLCFIICLAGSANFATAQSPGKDKKIIGIISKIVPTAADPEKSDSSSFGGTVYVKTLEGETVEFVFQDLSAPAAPIATPPPSPPPSPLPDAAAEAAAAADAKKRQSATITARKRFKAGQMVESTMAADSAPDNPKYDLNVIGETISGTVKEVSPDKSWVIIRTQYPEYYSERSANGSDTTTENNPTKGATGSPADTAKKKEKVMNQEANAEKIKYEEEMQFSPNINVSLLTGPKFEPVVAALRRGDGVNLTYKFPERKDSIANVVQALEWQSVPVSRFYRWVSLLAATGSLLLLAFIFSGKPTTLILGEDNRYSTSKFQAVLWFWLVISGYMAIVFHRMNAAGWNYIGGVDIPPNLLFLSGISVLTYAGAKLITKSQIEDAAAKGEVIRTRADEPAVKNLITSKGDRVDLGDYQIVVITILAVVVYAVGVVEFMEHIEFRREITMPDVDATLLAIFGLGQAAYLGKKYAGDTPSAQTPESALQASVVIASKAKIDADKADTTAKQAIAKAEEAKATAGKADAAPAKVDAVKEAEAALSQASTARTAADAAMTAAKAAEAKAKDASKLLADWGKGENAAKFTKDSTDSQAEAIRAMKSANDADIKVKEVEAVAKKAKVDADGKP